MSHNTAMILHTCNMEHNFSEVCGHTDMAKRKVNHTAEQQVNRQAASVNSLR